MAITPLQQQLELLPLPLEPYPEEVVLCVGPGDASFELWLALRGQRRMGVAFFERQLDVERRYGRCRAYCWLLEALGAVVLHKVDATEGRSLRAALARLPGGERTRIIWNFPRGYTQIPGQHEEAAGALVSSFLHCAAAALTGAALEDADPERSGACAGDGSPPEGEEEEKEDLGWEALCSSPEGSEAEADTAPLLPSPPDFATTTSPGRRSFTAGLGCTSTIQVALMDRYAMTHRGTAVSLEALSAAEGWKVVSHARFASCDSGPLYEHRQSISNAVVQKDEATVYELRPDPALSAGGAQAALVYDDVTRAAREEGLS